MNFSLPYLSNFSSEALHLARLELSRNDLISVGHLQQSIQITTPRSATLFMKAGSVHMVLLSLQKNLRWGDLPRN